MGWIGLDGMEISVWGDSLSIALRCGVNNEEVADIVRGVEIKEDAWTVQLPEEIKPVNFYCSLLFDISLSKL